MRKIINLALIALIALFVWVLISGIREPILFKAELDKREGAVEERLKEIRVAQELHRDITGGFAPTFDSLNYVLRNGRIPTISVFGDPDDPSNTEAIRYDTSYVNASDKVVELELNLDSLRYVPFSNNEVFSIFADTLTYQSTLVHVVEVGVEQSKFIGKLADPRYARYDNSYDPKRFLKFGDRNAPNTSGNWE